MKYNIGNYGGMSKPGSTHGRSGNSAETRPKVILEAVTAL